MFSIMPEEIKYYCYNEYIDGDDTHIVVKSTTEILDNYYAYWFNKVKEIRGEEFANSLTWESCIEDWCAINYAWELRDE